MEKLLVAFIAEDGRPTLDIPRTGFEERIGLRSWAVLRSAEEALCDVVVRSGVASPFRVVPRVCARPPVEVAVTDGAAFVTDFAHEVYVVNTYWPATKAWHMVNTG